MSREGRRAPSATGTKSATGAKGATSATRSAVTPRATVRLQLHKGFTFDDAAALVPYFARLGMSHVYTSPVLQAAPGSTHGYDVIDHSRVNEELGGEPARARFCGALEANKMGWLLDIVPNHMAINDRKNAWWWDVLESGPSSPHASFFDIDWDPPQARLKGVVLAPILGDHRGNCVDRGEINVVRQEAEEAVTESGDVFLVRYFDHTFPLAPRTHDVILAAAARMAGLDDDTARQLDFLAEAYRDLPLATDSDRALIRRRHRDKQVLRALLVRLLSENAIAAAAVDAAVSALNADPEALDALLERQNYRLAFWRTAERELDYRRFFDINHLVGLRTEDDLVFEESHRLIFEWVDAGEVDGLRVDHVDGLADPESYLERLRARLPSSWIVVEKILCDGEELPQQWRIDGTSGYDFLGAVNAVFVDPAGEEALTSIESRFTGEVRPFEELAREKRALVLRDVLASDVERVASMTFQLCSGRRHMRDYTRHELHDVICAVAASFPVYRCYVGDHAVAAASASRRAATDGARAPAASAETSGRAHETDRHVIARAIADARAHRPELDARALSFLESVLAGDLDGDVDGAQARDVRVRFQQLTGPATAKGVEDTAFYCAHRLASLCEVGGSPARFGISVEDFHQHNARAQERWPKRLLATSTHDTKRSEDVRTRISLLSEAPAEWASLVDRLSSVGARHKSAAGQPDRGAELLLFQTLVGAWPIDGDRLATFAVKAAREAKVHTSWTRQDKGYEEALESFARGLATDDDVRRAIEGFLGPLLPAARLSSIAQTLLKMTSPGVPDLYQGCDLWDESLVDPDNRRPVDWTKRERALTDLEKLDPREAPEATLARLDEGLPKMHVIRQACAVRARHEASFGAGERGRYEPIGATGPASDHVIAFARGGDVVTVVPRLAAGLGRRGGFGETTLPLPLGTFTNVLTGETLTGGVVRLATLLARFPVALLERAEPGGGKR